MSQTAVQQANTIQFGSAKFEVAALLAGPFTNLGAMRNIKFDETWTKISVMSDNAGEIRSRITEHKATLSGDLMELDLANLNLIRGGIDILTPVLAVPVVGFSQIVYSGLWNYNKFIPLTHQMGAKTMITVTSVTAATNGLLVVAVDYDNVLVGGVSGIIVKDSATVTTEAQNLTIVYTYTPAASNILSSGGKYTITPIVVKITNTDESAKDCTITLYKASNASGIVLNLESDDSGNPNVIPISLQGDVDVARSAGDQLFIIESAQI